MDRTTPAKAPDFSPTKSQIYVDQITIMDLNMHYDVQQREKKHAAKNQTFIRCWVIMCISAPCR